MKLPSSWRSSGVDGGGAALDVLAVDQQHQHVVHAIAMHAFGGRLAGLAGAGLDAELVRLHMPLPGRRRQGTETVAAERQDPAHAGAVGDAGRIGRNQRWMSPCSGL